MLLEAAIVVLAAAAFGFAANELSPRGLRLPATISPTHPLPAQPFAAALHRRPDQPGRRGGRDRPAFEEGGIQSIHRAETERLFHDQRYLQGLVVFVDAREQNPYADGHIPGAYRLDPFYPEKEIANALPPCQAADQIVVYCNGGDCDDADSTAIILRDAGVPAQKLFVYAGGYGEWTNQHLPVEKGERNSGSLTNPSK